MPETSTFSEMWSLAALVPALGVPLALDILLFTVRRRFAAQLGRR